MGPVRFLLWYGLAVAVLVYLLPMAGQFLQSHYDALDASGKFFAILGVFAAIGAWQALGMRDRR